MSTHSNPITNVTTKARVKLKKVKVFTSIPRYFEDDCRISLLEMTLSKIKKVIA